MLWINSINSANVARTQINLWCIYLKAFEILEIGDEQRGTCLQARWTWRQPGQDVDDTSRNEEVHYRATAPTTATTTMLIRVHHRELFYASAEQFSLLSSLFSLSSLSAGKLTDCRLYGGMDGSKAGSPRWAVALGGGGCGVRWAGEIRECAPIHRTLPINHRGNSIDGCWLLQGVSDACQTRAFVQHKRYSVINQLNLSSPRVSIQHIIHNTLFKGSPCVVYFKINLSLIIWGIHFYCH